MTRPDFSHYTSTHPSVSQTDPREGVLTQQQRENYRKLARVIYAHVAKTIYSPKRCADICRRRGSCAYFQPRELSPKEPDYVAHNLRNRDMPLCLASIIDESGNEQLKALATVALW